MISGAGEWAMVNGEFIHYSPLPIHHSPLFLQPPNFNPQNHSMAILITGATGYIGSKLTTKLAAQGHEVRILCRTAPTLPEFQKDNIKVFAGDITDKASLQPAMENVGQLYHLAAYARLWAKDTSTFHRLNVEALDNVLAAARDTGVSKVVYTSTAGVIGPSKENPMTENDPRITGFTLPRTFTEAGEPESV